MGAMCSDIREYRDSYILYIMIFSFNIVICRAIYYRSYISIILSLNIMRFILNCDI